MGGPALGGPSHLGPSDTVPPSSHQLLGDAPTNPAMPSPPGGFQGLPGASPAAGFAPLPRGPLPPMMASGPGATPRPGGGSGAAGPNRGPASSRNHFTQVVDAPKRKPELDPDLPEEVREAAADPARKIGRHILLDEVGRGGMGLVLRAYDLGLHREVAIKKLLPEKVDDDSLRRRFTKEAQSAARLKHHGIVAIHEVGEHEGEPFIVMDLVPGESLAHRLMRGALPSSEAAHIVSEMAQALAHAHDQGVIHRDIKPSNVILDREGRPAITDFGLARQNADPAGLTKTGTFLGTAGYVPPEQISGRLGEVGPASDVYALGAVLYHCLSGKLPFPGESAVNMLVATVREAPTPLDEYDSQIPDDLVRVTMRCLEKEPTQRYAAAADLADDLRRFLEGYPVEGRATGAAAARGRGTSLPTVAGAVLVGIAVGFLGATLRGGGGDAGSPPTSIASGSGGEGSPTTAAGAAVLRASPQTLAAARAAANDALAAVGPDLVEGAIELGAGADIASADAHLAPALDAVTAADRWLRAAEASNDTAEIAAARRAGRRAAATLREIAVAVQAWGTASRAIDFEESFGANAAEIEKARSDVETATRTATRAREAEVRAILTELRSAALYEELGGPDELVHRLVSLRSPQTVALLAVALDEVTEALSRVHHRLLAETAIPTQAEVASGEGTIEGLTAALDRCREKGPGHLHEGTDLVVFLEAIHRLDRRAARRGTLEDGSVVTGRHLVAVEQSNAVDENKLATAHVICRALGGMGAHRGAVEALGRYLQVEALPLRAITAARALLTLGTPEATLLVEQARGRFGADARFAASLDAFAARLEERRKGSTGGR